MIGRSAAGALAGLPQINTLHFNNLSLVIAGACTAVVSVLCTSLTTLIIYSIAFGLLSG